MCRARAVVFLFVLIGSSVTATAFEFNRTADGSPIRWNAAQPIHWKVASGTPEFVRSAFADALGKWSDASGGALSFVEAPGASGGITLTYNTASTLQSVMAYTRCDVLSGRIFNASIELNAATYNWETLYAAFLSPALLHETGHALGLEHPAADGSTVVGAFRTADPPTMWETLSLSARTLHYDDVIGLRTLYGLDTTSVDSTFACSEKHRGKVYTFTASAAPGDVYWNYGDGTSDATGAHRFPRGGYTVGAQSRGYTGTLNVQIGPVKAAAQRAPHKK